MTAIKTALLTLIENEPLAAHTIFRIGGPARLLRREEREIACPCGRAGECRRHVPWEILGGGSNVLASDKGFDGLIIQPANREWGINGQRITCEAGALMTVVARKAAEVGLTGFEWAVTVPGTIGGAIFGNAGCFGGEMKDVVTSVDAYRIADGKRVTLSREECRFGYRDSLFKHERHLILGCSLKLAAGDAAAALAKLDEYIAQRKEEQPLGTASAGCMFKNYSFSNDTDITKLRDEVDIPPAFIEARRIPAGWLVERAGFKGYRLGNVAVSEKHANFLVNLGGGTADEVAQLVSIIQMRVRDQYGIPLKTEVQFIGF